MFFLLILYIQTNMNEKIIYEYKYINYAGFIRTSMTLNVSIRCRPCFIPSFLRFLQKYFQKLGKHS